MVWTREIPFIDPVAAAARLTRLPGLAFLDSAMQHDTLGRVSVLAGYRAEDRDAAEALAPAILQELLSKRTADTLRQSEERFRADGSAPTVERP